MPYILDITVWTDVGYNSRRYMTSQDRNELRSIWNISPQKHQEGNNIFQMERTSGMSSGFRWPLQVIRDISQLPGNLYPKGAPCLTGGATERSPTTKEWPGNQDDVDITEFFFY